jgi:farnesyl diphosphate synthase
MSMASAVAAQDWAAQARLAVERALTQWVPEHASAGLGASMRYAVMGGGKRLRPLLCLAARRSVSAKEPLELREVLDQAALRAACAVELIHAYSLVHDDMPCMDNDVLRRGLPTVHVKFGQAQALLCGDALQSLAFELLTPEGAQVEPLVQVELCRLLSVAAGHAGMCGGQAIDLQSVGLNLNREALEEMHQKKTGALLVASVMMGAACAQAQLLPEGAVQHLKTYAAHLGLAFQVVDDILDVVGDTQTLGKTAGKDADMDKPTFVSLLGLPEAKALAQRLHDQAQAALVASQLPHTEVLSALAQEVIDRQH